MTNANNTSQSVQQAIDRLDEELTFLVEYTRPNLEQIAQKFADTVIVALRREPRWRSISRAELSLLLADAQRWLEQELVEQLDNRLPANVAFQAARDVLNDVLIENNGDASL